MTGDGAGSRRTDPSRSPRLRLARRVVWLVALAVPAWPLLELWLACRRPDSERCVWFRSLLPFSLTVGVVLGGLIALVGLLAIRLAARHSDGAHPPA